MQGKGRLRRFTDCEAFSSIGAGIVAPQNETKRNHGRRGERGKYQKKGRNGELHVTGSTVDK